MKRTLGILAIGAGALFSTAFFTAAFAQAKAVVIADHGVPWTQPADCPSREGIRWHADTTQYVDLRTGNRGATKAEAAQIGR